MTKVDNRPDAHEMKLRLRARVRELVDPIRVFEAFCGPTPDGMSTAWVGAEAHVGCDKRFAWPDPRQRYVGDTRRVMRAIDLQRFNVFDLDAYGSPWTEMLILLARRTWAAGERGALVITDGSGMKTKFGGTNMPRDVAALLGMRSLPPVDNAEVIHDACTAAWIERAGVRQVQRWRAVSRTSGLPMVYSAVVFEGVAPPAGLRSQDGQRRATPALWD